MSVTDEHESPTSRKEREKWGTLMCSVSAGVFLLGEGGGAPGTHFQIWERENKKVGHPPLVSIADDAHVISFRADGRFWYGCVYGWCFNTNLHERCDPPVVMFGWFGHPIDRAQVLAFGKKNRVQQPGRC
jgi:hypothetical protein